MKRSQETKFNCSFFFGATITDIRYSVKLLLVTEISDGKFIRSTPFAIYGKECFLAVTRNYTKCFYLINMLCICIVSQVSSAINMCPILRSQVTPLLFNCCTSSAFPVHLHSSKRMWRGPPDPFNTIPFSIERVNVTAVIKHARQAGREESPSVCNTTANTPAGRGDLPFITQVRQPHHCGEISRTTEQKIVIQWMTASPWHDRGRANLLPPSLKSCRVQQCGALLSTTRGTPCFTR